MGLRNSSTAKIERKSEAFMPLIFVLTVEDAVEAVLEAAEAATEVAPGVAVGVALTLLTVSMFPTLIVLSPHLNGKPWAPTGVALPSSKCANVPVVVADVTDAVVDADGHAGTVSAMLALLTLTTRSRKMILTMLMPCPIAVGEMDVVSAVVLTVQPVVAIDS
jgi:hypothetical protein